MKFKYSTFPLFIFMAFVGITLAFGKYVDQLSIETPFASIRLTQIAIVCLTILILPLIKTERLPRALFIYLFIYLLCGVLAFLIGLFSESSLQFLLSGTGIFLYSVFMPISYIIINTERRLKIFKNLIMWAAALGIVVFISYEFYVSGEVPYGIHLSSDILPIISASIFLLILSDVNFQNKKIAYGMIGFWFLGFIFFAGTKGVMLSLLASYFLMKIRSGYFLKNGFLMWFTVFAVVILFYFFLIGVDFDALQELSDRYFDNVQTFSILYRFLMLREMVSYISSSWIWGHGIISFDAPSMVNYFPEAVSENINPHNSYLLLLFYSGFLGLASLFFLIKALFSFSGHYSCPNNRRLVLSLQAAGTIFLVDSLTTPILEIYYLAPICWIFLGVAARAHVSRFLFRAT